MLLAILIAGAVGGCRADLLQPSAQTIAGRWRGAPVSLSPPGQYFRILEFTEDGHCVTTSELRGVYAQLPADSAGRITHAYGTYILVGDTLHVHQDSLWTWDYLGGTFVQIGPSSGIDIEGPNTDPIVELTATRLTLRYFVNPGDGYEQVTDRYYRDR
jgi:hypothetical protein